LTCGEELLGIGWGDGERRPKECVRCVYGKVYLPPLGENGSSSTEVCCKDNKFE
jgi:hypothetical protein